MEHYSMVNLDNVIYLVMAGFHIMDIVVMVCVERIVKSVVVHLLVLILILPKLLKRCALLYDVCFNIQILLLVKVQSVVKISLLKNSGTVKRLLINIVILHDVRETIRLMLADFLLLKKLQAVAISARK